MDTTKILQNSFSSTYVYTIKKQSHKVSVNISITVYSFQDIYHKILAFIIYNAITLCYFTMNLKNKKVTILIRLFSLFSGNISSQLKLSFKYIINSILTGCN